MGVWITLAWFINTISAPAYFAYLGYGKLSWITGSHILMGVINLFGGFFLGRFLGWQGVLGSFLVSLAIGSLLPVWSFHRENQIKARNVLSISDILEFGICFGTASIILVGYWRFVDNSWFDQWIRFGVATLFITSVSFVTVWYHPIRKKIFRINTVKINS